MSKPVTSIDISTIPDLVRLVEEVKKTKQPRLLKRDSETIAMLMPIGHALERHNAIDVFDFQPLETVRASLVEAGYPDAEVNEMLEALSELPQYANKGNALR